ncbi:enoyl-CoA hydratase-related protein [Devosia ginsengisoli]|uniref:enoyl-CoA hydratase-related protein n=1 Tax=Devosia ginsengisoli TaxID=400770 RepID=UPI0026EB12F6|nr:enoyl-CoA hydratase-related protein [Devosia ginsengisoli]MCR6671418.1 enoyl-CoA hydratase-related protein [Devosia ginsengisoli]
MSLVVERAGKVATVKIDRPPANALTLALYEEIADLFDELSGDSAVSCIILTATGSRAFCAGLDLKEFITATVEEDPHRAQIVRRTFAAVRHAKVPVIAAVNGPALGAGCVLASVCDIRLAAPNATFGLPEVNVGRCGGTAHMGRHLPQGILRQMVFTGKPISADEAYRFGFVNAIHAGDALLGAAEEMAAIIAEKAPLGLRLGKESMNAAEFMAVDDGYALEQTYSTRLMTTEDAREAARAVVEKRAPIFVGR